MTACMYMYLSVLMGFTDDLGVLLRHIVKVWFGCEDFFSYTLPSDWDSAANYHARTWRSHTAYTIRADHSMPSATQLPAARVPKAREDETQMVQRVDFDNGLIQSNAQRPHYIFLRQMLSRYPFYPSVICDQMPTLIPKHSIIPG